MSRSFLIVLPNEMRSGVAPARKRKLDLDDRRRVEARAEIGQELEHLPAPDSPSRRRTRACREAPGQNLE